MSKHQDLVKNPETQTDLLTHVKVEMKKNPPISEDNFTVVKRNGSIVPFKKDRIFLAIEAAFREVKKIPKEDPISPELLRTIQHITSLVIDQIKHLVNKGVSITVEGIQDIVEITLMKSNFHDIARSYIIYRDHHKQLREDAAENLRVLRREDETPVRFNPMKVASTIEKAFRTYHEIEGQTPEEIITAVNLLTEKVVQDAKDFCKEGSQMHIHHVQDMIENELMKEGYFNVAKEYILTRAKLGQQTVKPSQELERKKITEKQRKFKVIQKDGSTKSITESDIRKHIKFVCKDLEHLVSAEELIETTISNFYDGMKEEEIDMSHIMATRAKIEKEPAYSKITARLLLDTLYRESLGVKASHPQLKSKHTEYFQWYIKHGITIERIG